MEPSLLRGFRIFTTCQEDRTLCSVSWSNKEGGSEGSQVRDLRLIEQNATKQKNLWKIGMRRNGPPISIQTAIFHFPDLPVHCLPIFPIIPRKCFKTALQSNSTSNSLILQIIHLTVTAGSWGADGISRGALIPSGGAFFTTSEKTLQSQIQKKKRKRTFLPKPPRNQATSPRVDTSVCANTANGAHFPPTPGFRKNHQPKKKLQQRKTTEIPPTSPPRDQNTRHHGIARRTPRKAL